ncbi:MAG: DUF2062 domain-containing protein [Kiritimatiellae bacterium]|nr:DUF2062 domain-containing protein [Kiritimatiellia bacterium]
MSWIREKVRALYFKIVREKASPQFIAKGWAIGMCVGCAIPFGVQICISLPTAFLLKGSKIGATLGTLITNPVSIWFIYPAQCWVGSRILGKDVSWTAINKALACVLREQEWSALAKLSGHLVTSFFAGGFLFAAIMTPITYYTVLNMVKGYRIVHERVRRKKKSSRE